MKKQILLINLANYNETVNDMNKFKLNDREINLFCDIMQQFAEKYHTEQLRIHDVSSSASIEKPKKEKYGWHTQESFDDLPSGWQIEGGEEAYYEALKKWESRVEKLREEKYSFGKAVELLKEGKKVMREGWNGKGMWLELILSRDYIITIPPEKWKAYDNVELLPWIGMKTADNKFVPWLASQTDILSTDWKVLPED